MDRHTFLAGLHARLDPRTYLEIGVQDGKSLALGSAPRIGVDPEFQVKEEIQQDVHLARTTSDEFFARRRPLAHLPVDVLDLVFIDGMHLAEYVVRDVLAVERFTHPASVIVLDDILPRDPEKARRVRITRGWTGDVFKALDALRTHRPDLVVIEVDCEGTGAAVVLSPDASLDGVAPWYDDWLDVAVSPDPPHVPVEVLERSRAWTPEELFELDVWEQLARARRLPAAAAAPAVAQALAPLRRPAPRAS
ncbi:hypothetical protein GCM10009737_26540 [Nocardioides lentus]|uniref:Class I SAM-dependent methyltransferase n=1 Tax=Nocardioides lentus TaxID=338077 RepID=A0ABN2PJU6_9ACTN